MDSDQIVDLSIGNGDIANGAITTDKIANGAVDANKIPNGVIANGHISASASIDQSKINGLDTDLSNLSASIATKEAAITANGNAATFYNGEKKWATINSDQLTEGSTNRFLKANSVTSTQLKDNAVTNNKLAGSITDDKLNQITTAEKVHNSATTANTSIVAHTIALRDGAGNISAAPPTASEHLTTKSYVDTKVASVTLESLAADTCNDGEIIIKTSSGWECSTMPGSSSGPPDRLKFYFSSFNAVNDVTNGTTGGHVIFKYVYTDFDSSQSTSTTDLNVGSSYTTITDDTDGTTVTINESGLYAISFYGATTGCLTITISGYSSSLPQSPDHIGGNSNCVNGGVNYRNEPIDTVKYLKQGTVIGAYLRGNVNPSEPAGNFSFEIIRVK